METYSSMGLVMTLYVASIASICFPHVVDVSALSICIVLHAFVVLFSMCLLHVSLGWSFKEYLCCVCNPSVRLGVPSICQ